MTRAMLRLIAALVLALAGAYALPLGGDWHADPAHLMHAAPGVDPAGTRDANGCSTLPDPSGDGTYYYSCPTVTP